MFDISTVGSSSFTAAARGARRARQPSGVITAKPGCGPPLVMGENGGVTESNRPPAGGDSLIDDLLWRGLIQDSTDLDELRGAARRRSRRPSTSGFDPTAPSLHVGHLMQVITARRLQLAGHRPLLLVGGRHRADRRPEGERRAHASTRRRWSPAGWSASASSSRPSSRTTGDNAARLVNNLDWTGEMSVVEFLRDVGKHFPVNKMLAREVVRARLESGISFTEFSYQLLQANDFFELHRRLRLPAAVRRLRPVGQHHRRRRLRPPPGRRAGAGLHHPAGDQGRRHEVRQDRGRRGLARPRDDQPVRLLPVLGQRRRPGRRPVPAVLQLPRPRARWRSWRRRRPSGRRPGSRSGRWPRS